LLPDLLIFRVGSGSQRMVPQNELIKRTRQVIKHSDELRHRSEACRRRAEGTGNPN
jgi:hypothetical protein